MTFPRLCGGLRPPEADQPVQAGGFGGHRALDRINGLHVVKMHPLRQPSHRRFVGNSSLCLQSESRHDVAEVHPARCFFKVKEPSLQVRQAADCAVERTLLLLQRRRDPRRRRYQCGLTGSVENRVLLASVMDSGQTL